jgi:hypothetical protein
MYRVGIRTPSAQVSSDYLASFCPRSVSIVEGIQSDLSDMCMSEDQWAIISKRFCLHSLLIKAIKRKTISASVVEGLDQLRQYTITTSSDLHDSFAISSTHFEDKYLDLVVVLGSTNEQVDLAQKLLGLACEGHGHPYLALGLSAELLLRRLEGIVEETVNDCVEATRAMPTLRQDLATSWKSINQVRELRVRSKQVEEEVKKTQRCLESILPARLRDDDALTVRFHKRFDEINRELNGLINKGSIYADEMSFNAETIRGELARQDAVSGTRLAQSSVVIAFVAMIYLPMTSVAVSRCLNGKMAKLTILDHLCHARV